MIDEDIAAKIQQLHPLIGQVITNIGANKEYIFIETAKDTASFPFQLIHDIKVDCTDCLKKEELLDEENEK